MRLNGVFNLRELGDESMLIGEVTDHKKGLRRVVRINSSAAFLWRSVSGREFEVSDLADLLSREYGLDPETALSDAAATASEWRSAGLLAG